MSKAKALRERVYQKYNGHCAYCGTSIEYKQMQIDHYLPQCREKFYAHRCKKDVHAEENLMPSCRRCNHYKRGRTPRQFRELMASLHERLQQIYILKVAVDFGIATIKPFDGNFYFEKLLQRKEQKISNPTTLHSTMI